ncbi:MAG TPA: DUF1934 domain-containing protein [Ruminococcaceae bacterium]|nr:DUF1934 domain-containing protein [Oscillospiraceae bacterium]
MKEKVIITISDSHEIDGEREESRLTTVGELERTENGCILTYEETEDFKGSRVTITYTGKRIDMVRSGTHCANLTIEPGKRYTCAYSTEYGDLTLGIFGKEIRAELSEKDGHLFFSYTLDFDAGFCSQNDLTIDYRSEETKG